MNNTLLYFFTMLTIYLMIKHMVWDNFIAIFQLSLHEIHTSFIYVYAHQIQVFYVKMLAINL